MKHLWCWLALGCALVCYGQRCVENRLWWTIPIWVVLIFGPILGMGAVLIWYYGWLAKASLLLWLWPS